MDRWLIDAVENIQSANNLGNIKDVLVKTREHLGFSNVAYVVMVPNSFLENSALVVSDYPVEWQEHYGKQNYAHVDPVVAHCFSTQTPYWWEQGRRRAKNDQQQFFAEATDFQLRDGISIGLPRFDGYVGLMSLASDRTLSLGHKQQQQLILQLNALQPFIQERIIQLAGPSQYVDTSIQLSEREKACLKWVAEGKTAHGIGEILHISESTVVFHLKSAIKKLNVSNRSHAVAKATLLGLIEPQFPADSVQIYHF